MTNLFSKLPFVCLSFVLVASLSGCVAATDEGPGDIDDGPTESVAQPYIQAPVSDGTCFGDNDVVAWCRRDCEARNGGNYCSGGCGSLRDCRLTGLGPM